MVSWMVHCINLQHEGQFDRLYLLNQADRVHPNPMSLLIRHLLKC